MLLELGEGEQAHRIAADMLQRRPRLELDAACMEVALRATAQARGLPAAARLHRDLDPKGTHSKLVLAMVQACDQQDDYRRAVDVVAAAVEQGMGACPPVFGALLLCLYHHATRETPGQKAREAMVAAVDLLHASRTEPNRMMLDVVGKFCRQCKQSFAMARKLEKVLGEAARKDGDNALFAIFAKREARAAPAK
eukprot:m.130376 g.130376  ORF g.130376 m.130376 type:complete len:195 (+) comp19978_c0_seq2:1051-1635(+)